jgi:hypothetical protein
VDRVQAMSLLKEIANKVPELGLQSMSIVESEPNNPLRKGFSINFKGLSTDCIEQIKTIVKNRSLAILDNEVDLVIYTPSKDQNLSLA